MFAFLATPVSFLQIEEPKYLFLKYLIILFKIFNNFIYKIK